MSIKIKKHGTIGIGVAMLLIAIAIAGICTASAVEEILDQNQTEYNTFTNPKGVQWRAQTFTAGETGDLTNITLRIGKTGAPPTPLTVEIRNVSPDDTPGSTVYASAARDDITTEQDYNFSFSPHVPVTSGTEYAIVIHCAAGGVRGDRYDVMMKTNEDLYNNGNYSYSYDGNSSWHVENTYDLYFMAYVEPIPVLPPTYLTATWNQTDNTVNVSWDGTEGGLYDIYISSNYTAGFSNIPNTTVNALSWIDTNAASYPQRYYKVGLSGSNWTNETVGKFDISLNTGLNLISLPLIYNYTTIADLFGAHLTGGTSLSEADTVSKWNGTGYQTAWYCEGTGNPAYDGKWLTGYVETTMTLGADEGCEVHIREGHPSANVTSVGKVSTTNRTIAINVGWNLVGSTFPVSVSIKDSGLAESGATGGPSQSQADTIYKWTGTGYQTAWYCDGTGNPAYDGKWLTGYAETTITLDPTVGYRILVRDGHAGFTWNYPVPY